MTFQDDLGPTRLKEARRFLDTVLSREGADRNHLLIGLHSILTGQVPVIAGAANELRLWNENSDNGKKFEFIGDDDYRTIAEIVLDAAAQYFDDKDADSTIIDYEPNELLTEQGVLDSLQSIRLFLRSVAAGKTNARMAERHASHLGYISTWLRETRFTQRPVD